jgi:predicted Zn-dependent peptidase
MTDVRRLANLLQVCTQHFPPPAPVHMELTFVEVGSQCESRGNYGGAHLVEHMMFGGTDPRAPLVFGRVARVLREHPASFVADAQARLAALAPPAAPLVGAAADTWFSGLLARDGLTVGDQFGLRAAAGVLYLGPNHVDRLARTFGADMNAFTSVNKTSYWFETATAENAKVMLAVLAAMAERFYVDDAKLATEIGAVLQELKATSDNPFRQAFTELNKLMFSPFETGHRSTIGDEVELQKQSAALLLRFYRDFYSFDKAVLTVVGGGVEGLQDHIDLCFGYPTTFVPATAPPLPGPAHVVPPVATTRGVVYANVVAPMTLVGLRLPGYDDPGALSPETWAAAMDLLGGGVLSRARRLFTSCGSNAFVARFKHTAAVYVVLDPSPPSGAGGVAKAVFEHLLLPPTADEVRVALYRHEVGALVAQDSVRETANHLVGLFTQGVDPRSLAAGRAKPTADGLAAAFERMASRAGQHHLVEVVPSPGPATPVGRAQLARRRVRAANALLRGDLDNTRGRPAAAAAAAAAAGPPVPGAVAAWAMASMRAALPRAVSTAAHQTPAVRAFLHPSSGLATYLVCTPAAELEAEAAGLARFLPGVVAGALLRTPQLPAVLRLEQRGARYDVNGSGATLVEPLRPGGEEAFAQDVGVVRSLMQPRTLHADAFRKQRALTALRLRGQAKKPLDVAMHACRNAFQYTTAFSFEEAAAYVESLRRGPAAAAFRARNAKPREFLVRPRPADSRASAAPVPHPGPPPAALAAAAARTAAVVAGEAVLLPPVRRLPAGNAAQAAVLLGRPGLGGGRSVDPEFTARCVVLQYICFHSLGSRLYRLRTEKGLFYSARGAFNVGAARRGYAGFDFIATTVELGAVDRTLEELAAFCAGMRDAPKITAAELQAAQRAYDTALSRTLVSSQRSVGLVHRLLQRFPDRPWQVSLQAEAAGVRSLDVRSINALCERVFKPPWSLRVVAN